MIWTEETIILLLQILLPMVNSSRKSAEKIIFLMTNLLSLFGILIVIPTAPAPILLSSPFQVQGTNNMHHPPQQHRTHNNSIHINSLLLPTQTAATKVTKRYQKKKRPSLTNSSSTTTSSSSSAGEDLNRKPAANTKKVQQENRKQAHELLSDDQKRANHIASEQKRRANIRIGFEKLVDIVPTLSNGYKSEALILQKCKFSSLLLLIN